MRTFAVLACICLAGCSQTAPDAKPKQVAPAENQKQAVAETDPFRIRLAAFLEEASAAAVMLERVPNPKQYRTQSDTVGTAFAKLPEKAGAEAIREASSKLSYLVGGAGAWVELDSQTNAMRIAHDDQSAQGQALTEKMVTERRKFSAEIRQQITVIRKMAELP